ncbi:hypothetical protein K435DRAFT_806691 [Dendrothele bispora CBS 962.96]|uniref:Uncharacterized protein n=1 Tax=Dendrothele bispora (strain CBS 962.96) TaxID=1314807 RepID=A0A4S8L7F2_DENBC|nr:hypothetical protein K435DRAFT_806691 [Dendrothele bispora CBS 962.96]
MWLCTTGNRAEEQLVVVNSADNTNPDFRTPKLGSELQEAIRVYDFEKITRGEGKKAARKVELVIDHGANEELILRQEWNPYVLGGMRQIYELRELDEYRSFSFRPIFVQNADENAGTELRSDASMSLEEQSTC